MEGDVTVRELMTREYVGVSESDPVSGAVQLLIEENEDAAVVLRGSEPIGMLTKTDALAHLTGGGDGDDRVTEAMSGTMPSVPSDAGFVDAANKLAEAGIECLLVTGGDEVVGLVTVQDVAGAAASLSTRPAHEGGRDRTLQAATVEGGEATDVETEYSRQSVCETCGSLTPDLQNFNGQLICADCREV